MTYQVCRHDNNRVSIEVDGCEAFVFKRAAEGSWAQFVVRDGRTFQVECDDDGDALIDRTVYNLANLGHAAKVAAGYVVQVPVDTSDFYLSGLGYLCCRTPVRMAVSLVRVGKLGIEGQHQIRPATPEEERAAGFDGKDATLKTVFLLP